jgi:hypothetical protein
MVESTNNTLLADELTKLKFHMCDHEGQEDARKNSGNMPNICCNPAIMALACPDTMGCIEDTSPNNEGGDYQSAVELRYPLDKQEKAPVTRWAV